MVSDNKLAVLATLLLIATQTVLLFASAYEDTCQPFPEIYADGTELCEVMWGGAFEVVADDENNAAYTMWFFDHENNPNDEITRTLFGGNTTADETCHLDYLHKDSPSPEGDGMTECHPWKNKACCDKTTVPDVQTLNENYGEGYEWDRCGPMSQACERFFVMEACFYECEPAAGLFRKYKDNQDEEVEGFNKWQIEKMPIKKSFCNAWYDACRSDYFCGKGDYFACQEYYAQNKKEEELLLQEEELVLAEKNKTKFVIGISVACVVAVLGILLVGVFVWKEKQGTPLFSPDKGHEIS